MIQVAFLCSTMVHGPIGIGRGGFEHGSGGYNMAIDCLDLHGDFRILKWRYVSTIFLAIFSGDIP